MCDAVPTFEPHHMNFMWLQLRGSSSCKTGLTRSSFSVPMKCVLRVTAFWKKLVEKCPDADQQPLHHRLWLCRCVYIFNCMYAVHQTHLKHESAAVGCLQQTVTLDSHLIFLESDSSSRSSSRSRRSSGGSGSNASMLKAARMHHVKSETTGHVITLLMYSARLPTFISAGMHRRRAV